jgi:hypothetical protein
VANIHLLLVELDRLRGMRHALIESRLDFLRDRYVPLIAQALENKQLHLPRTLPINAQVMSGKDNPERAQKIFDAIVNADPDIHKKNSQWLLNLFLKPAGDGHAFLLEDLEKATYYLDVYQKVKAKLQPNARDLNRYKSLPDLYAAIEPLEQDMSKREADRQADAQMHGQAKVVYNTSTYKIVIPLTKEASCYFGMNTQWCTAATRGQNYFDSYNKDGPLYIILEKATNKRWQFHVATGQFADERDHMIDVKAFAGDHPEVMEALNANLPQPVATFGKNELPVFMLPGKIVVKRGDEPITSSGTPVLELMIEEGEFTGISSDRNAAGYAGFKTEELSYFIAELLNDLKVPGDPQAAPSTYMADLYYRNDYWQTALEAAIPTMKFKDGWVWCMVGGKDISTGEMIYHYLLKYTDFDEEEWWGPARRIGYACEAFLKQGGDFLVTDIPILPNQSNTRTTHAFHARNNVRQQVGKYIVDLLLQSEIPKKWLTDNNEFSPSQLSEADQKRLIESKPFLGNLKTVFNIYGATDDTRRMVIEDMEAADLETSADWIDGSNLIIEEWSDLDEAIDNIANKDGYNFYKNYIRGDMSSLDFWPQHDIMENVGDFLGHLAKQDPAALTALGKHLASQYPDEADEIEDFDPSDADNIEELFRETKDDDLETVIRRAIARGMETGAQDQAIKIFKRAINNSPYLWFKNKDKWEHEFIWDTSVALAVPMKKIVEMFDDDDQRTVSRNGWLDYLEARIGIEEPSYGFDDYDNNAANEAFSEEVHEMLPE